MSVIVSPCRTRPAPEKSHRCRRSILLLLVLIEPAPAADPSQDLAHFLVASVTSGLSRANLQFPRSVAIVGPQHNVPWGRAQE